MIVCGWEQGIILSLENVSLGCKLTRQQNDAVAPSFNRYISKEKCRHNCAPVFVPSLGIGAQWGLPHILGCCSPWLLILAWFPISALFSPLKPPMLFPNNQKGAMTTKARLAHLRALLALVPTSHVKKALCRLWILLRSEKKLKIKVHI